MSRETPALESLYQEIILEHQRDPRNFGELKKPTAKAEGFNPMCGDRVTVELELDEKKQKILDQKFHGEGCSICMASASMMTEAIEGLSLKEALNSIESFRSHFKEENSKKLEGDLESLSGVKRFPVRVKCAVLPWTTLKAAIENCPILHLPEGKRS